MGSTRDTKQGEENFIQGVGGESDGNGTTCKTQAWIGRYY